MKINLDLPPEEVQIQIVPLIDVIFCILTFFILAALQITRPNAISVDLPKANTGTAQMMRDMLVVSVSPNGQIYVDQNQQPIDQVQLYQVLQTYRQTHPNGLLVLNASQMAFYNDVLQVLDLMRLVGGDRVALATQPATPNQTPNQIAPTNLQPGGVQPNPALGVPNLTPGGVQPNPAPGVPGLTQPSNPGNSGSFPLPSTATPAPGFPTNSTPLPGSQGGINPNPNTVSPTTAPGATPNSGNAF